MLPLVCRLEEIGSDTPQQRRAVLNAFDILWSKTILDHMLTVENVLLPVTRDPEQRNRLLDDHRRLRLMAERVPSVLGDDALDPVWIRNLGRRFREHLEWQRDVWYPTLRRTVPPARLLACRAAIEERQHRHLLPDA